MFGALKHGFRRLATLKLVVNIVGELQTKKNSYGIVRFPCDSTAFLLEHVSTASYTSAVIAIAARLSICLSLRLTRDFIMA